MADSSDWFAKRMGVPQQQQQPNYTQPPTPTVPQQFTPQNPAYPTQQYVPEQTGARPTASVESTRCPGCGSGNYGKSPMAPESKARCYDCGYPLVQSGSGMGSAGSQATGGPAIPAKQIQTGGFNPTTIIGHI